MQVRADLNISLDGYAAPPPGDGTPDNPLGEDWSRLVAPYMATRTFQTNVFGHHDTGTTGVNDRYAVQYFEGIGAEIMGAGKFGLHMFGDDPEWRGWWGDNPPFHHPVFVLTHTAPRPSLGRGENLWDGLRNVDLHFDAVSEAGEDGVSHVTFTRRDSVRI
jgi:hypothetical protein